jgi:predicted phage-related endonuclease
MTFTKEERIERQKRLGASEAAAVLGCDRFKGPWDVWASKVLPVADDEGPSSLAAQRGHWLENLLLDTWCIEHSEKPDYLVRQAKLTHVSEPWLGCTFDGLGPHFLVVQAKTQNHMRRHLWGEPGSNAIPIEYLLQEVIEIAVANSHAAQIGLDVDHSDVIVDFGQDLPLTYTVWRNEELERVVIASLGQWWQHCVVEKNEPDPDGSGGMVATVLRQIESVATWIVQADDAAEAAHRAFIQARSDEKEAKERKEKAANTLKAKIKGAGAIHGSGWSHSWEPNVNGVRTFR